jgi:hypothetical protein
MGDIIDNIDDELNEEDIDFNTDDDDELIDITIEITIDESHILPEDSEILLDEEVSTHKQDGKHSLKYDSIFKGKKDDENYEDSDVADGYFNETFELDKTSSFYFETRDNESYLREKRVKEKVYDVLTTKTNLNLLNNRRKPSKIDFNSYYCLYTLMTHHYLVGDVADDLFSEYKNFAY